MRSHRALWVTVLSAAALAGSFAYAHAGALGSGALEFTPTVAFSRSSFTPVGGGAAGTDTHASLDASVGRYFSEQWELAGGLLVQHLAAGGSARNAVGGVARAIYNAPAQGNLMPFVSAGIGALQFSSSGATDRALLFPVLRAGFRSTIGEDRTINISVGFQHEINNQSAFNASADMFDVGIGFSIMRAK